MSVWNPKLGRFEVYAKVEIVGMGDWTTLGEPNQQRVIQRFASISGPIKVDPERYFYTRSRAVSAYEKHGLNDNGDGFEHVELASRFPTFIGAGRYLDHANDDPKKTFGIIVDAVYHQDAGWVEVFSIYERGIPKDDHHPMSSDELIDGIKTGKITDVSMGCLVSEAICTLCGNKATTPWEYCGHVLLYKGLPVMNDKSEVRIAGEINRGVTFFELSDITTVGADRDAKHLQHFASSGTKNSVLSSVVDRRRELAVQLARA